MEAGKSTCTTCGNLIRLCGGLDFFPSDPEVRRLLIERLHRLAKNHDHATEMIDAWLTRQTVAPKIADLVNLAGEVRSDNKALPEGCSACQGALWIVNDRGARRCTCARGQALRAKDIENGVAKSHCSSARAFTSATADFLIEPPAHVQGGRMTKADSISVTYEHVRDVGTRRSTRESASEGGSSVTEQEVDGYQYQSR